MDGNSCLSKYFVLGDLLHFNLNVYIDNFFLPVLNRSKDLVVIYEISVYISFAKLNNVMKLF